MPIYIRQFEAPLTVGDLNGDAGDGRTVFGRIVPYNEVISFLDPYDGRVKKERFVRGAFAKQSDPGAWSRVGLSFQHNDGMANTIGYGRSIVERDDGAYATFRLYQADASKAREMMDTTYKGLSLEFEPRGNKDRIDSDGVIIRDSVHVRRVGITDDPAYKRAEVLAVRERSDVEEGKTPTPNLDAVIAYLQSIRGAL